MKNLNHHVTISFFGITTLLLTCFIAGRVAALILR
jgi:hypothetical protein